MVRIEEEGGYPLPPFPLTNRPNSLYYNELGRFVRGGGEEGGYMYKKKKTTWNLESLEAIPPCRYDFRECY